MTENTFMEAIELMSEIQKLRNEIAYYRGSPFNFEFISKKRRLLKLELKFAEL